MPTSLNTQRIIDTLRSTPWPWIMHERDRYFGWASGECTPFTAVTIEKDGSTATMSCVFSPDLPEHIAIRNMNYLLVFVAAAGAPDALDWVLGRVKQALAADTYRRSIVVNQRHIYLQIDTQRSLTTVTIRPCNARVYVLPTLY